MSDYGSDFQDKQLKCRECGADFVFSAGEQAFFREKELMNEPQRCPTCRSNRRRERSGAGQREHHPVVCAECGQQATVPFVPRNDRPVYCAECYERIKARQ